MREPGLDPDVHIFPAGPTIADGEASCHLAVGLIRPHSRGTVRLRQGEPAIAPGLLTDPDDREVLTAGARLAQRIADTAPLRRLLEPQFTDADLEALVRTETASYQHPVGTCRMGPDGDPATVTDTRGAVHGIGGLHVADASVMPAIPRADTNLTTLMLAERFAEHLAA